MGGFFRRERDSNPRSLVGSTVFKTASFDRSDIPPFEKIYYTQKSLKNQAEVVSLLTPKAIKRQLISAMIPPNQKGRGCQRL